MNPSIFDHLVTLATRALHLLLLLGVGGLILPLPVRHYLGANVVASTVNNYLTQFRMIIREVFITAERLSSAARPDDGSDVPRERSDQIGTIFRHVGRVRCNDLLASVPIVGSVRDYAAFRSSSRNTRRNISSSGSRRSRTYSRSTLLISVW
jgi:hypothetical protein